MYLVPVSQENPSEPDNSDVTKNDKVKVDNSKNTITAVPNATVSDLKSLMGDNITVKNVDGQAVDGKLATGYKVNDTYTISVLGDVNGDGETTALDAAIILRYTVDQYNLTGVYIQSGSLSSGGVPTALDAAKILRYTVGQYNINV